jgi:hypothetical protein
LPLFLSAQVTDNFSDGNFSDNPKWSGDDSLFKCNLADTNYILQLDATIPKTAYLYTSNTMFDSTEWRFYMKMNFSPSSTSYARVYLVSDNSNLNGSLNGYYLQFGETNSTDVIRLFKQTGTSSALICSGTTSIASAFEINVKVTRSKNGTWKIFSAPAFTQKYNFEGTGSDMSFKSTSYLGILCKFSTSSYNKNFYFDDFFVGNISVDTVLPKISDIKVVSGNKIDVVFSEFVEKNSSENILNYNVNNGVGNPATTIRDISDSTIVHLTFSSEFLNGAENILTVNGVKDITGNTMTATYKIFYFYHPEALDIVINEILFNPKNDGVDFVELYNRSAKIVDLKEINLCSFDTIKNILISIDAITQQTYFLNPGEYVVLTIAPDKVKSQYFTSNPNVFIKMNSLPSFNNDKGFVVISDKSSNIIDMFKYSEKMHFALLNNVEGVSLERVDFNRPTQDATNWHSASETVGYATPGYKNSQYNSADSSDNAITISPEIFSPDNDGHNDLLNISYNFFQPDYIANIAIYDSNGRLIKNLAKNKRLDAKGIISWDGINETNEKCRMGIYVIYFETFDLQGKVKHYKKTCVLGGKLK